MLSVTAVQVSGLSVFGTFSDLQIFRDAKRNPASLIGLVISIFAAVVKTTTQATAKRA
jgi:hypothetical protein